LVYSPISTKKTQHTVIYYNTPAAAAVSMEKAKKQEYTQKNRGGTRPRPRPGNGVLMGNGGIYAGIQIKAQHYFDTKGHNCYTKWRGFNV